MKQSTLIASALISLCALNNLHARDIPDQNLYLGGAGLVAAGILVVLAAEHTIAPWWTERHKNAQRKKAYEQADAIRRKYEELPNFESTSLNDLKTYIQEIKNDKATLEELQHTVPFKPGDATKSAQPLEVLSNALAKQANVLETHYALDYLNQVCNLYGQELNLMETGKLSQNKIKECVDERCGGVSFRHQVYLDKLEGEIISCGLLFEKLGQEAITDDDRVKWGALETFLRSVTRLLTPELQLELQLKAKTERDQTQHEAELSCKREETAAYRKCKNVCADLQAAVNTHGAMMAEVAGQVNGVKKAVREVKEEISHGRLWEHFIRGLDQAGSENRVVEGVKQALMPLIQKLLNDHAIMKEKMKSGQQGQAYVPPADPYMPPPAVNPEYTASQAYPSAPY